MRTSELLEQIDVLAAGDEKNFDTLAREAGLDPRVDFIGMDLRTANFSGSNLRDFDFALCDVRGSNIDRAKIAPRNLEYAITDQTISKLSGSRLTKMKRLIEQFMGARTATKRLVAFVEFVTTNRDVRLLEFAANSLLKAAQTRLEVRILTYATELLGRGNMFVAAPPDRPQLGLTERDKIVQLLSKSMVAGGYPYRRVEVALELSTLVPVSKGVETYLMGLAERSHSSSAAMRELQLRLAQSGVPQRQT